MKQIFVYVKEKSVYFFKNHVASAEFWRLIALVGKRLIGTAKLFAKLPHPFSIINYFLHFLRAILRIINYFRKTKNKNLGETRKLFFSGFKVIIALAAFVLCFFMPVPAVLGTAFLFYSLVKLLDSTGVLIFGIIAYAKLDKNSNQAQWASGQYLDNIIKHSSILTMGLPMTLLTDFVIAGSPWIMIFALSLTTLVLITYIAYFGYLCCTHFTLGPDSVRLKRQYLANIKSFSVPFLAFLFLLTLTVIALFFPLSVSIAGLSITLIPVIALGILNLFDAGKSIYDYIFFNKVADPQPKGLAYEYDKYVESSGYYGTKNVVNYLSIPNNKNVKETLRKNREIVFHATVSKITSLQSQLNKIQNFSKLKQGLYSIEKKKIKIKIEVLAKEIASFLNRNLKKEVNKEDYFVNFIKKIQLDFNLEYLQEIKKISHQNNNIKNVDQSADTQVAQENLTDSDAEIKTINKCFEADVDQKASSRSEEALIEMLKHILLQLDPEMTGQSHFVILQTILKIFIQFLADEKLQEEKSAESKWFHQSFYKKVGECTALSMAIKEAGNIEKQCFTKIVSAKQDPSKTRNETPEDVNSLENHSTPAPRAA